MAPPSRQGYNTPMWGEQIPCTPWLFLSGQESAMPLPRNGRVGVPLTTWPGGSERRRAGCQKRTPSSLISLSSGTAMPLKDRAGRTWGGR